MCDPSKEGDDITRVRQQLERLYICRMGLRLESAVRYAATVGPHRVRLNATLPHHRRQLIMLKCSYSGLCPLLWPSGPTGRGSVMLLHSSWNLTTLLVCYASRMPQEVLA
jgi:hypothetical protein